MAVKYNKRKLQTNEDNDNGIAKQRKTKCIRKNTKITLAKYRRGNYRREKIKIVVQRNTGKEIIDNGSEIQKNKLQTKEDKDNGSETEGKK